jgi:ribose 5-phosphate isomerase B
MNMNDIKNVAVGCDHAGFPYKASVIKRLEEHGYTVKDFGTYSLDSVDYPDYVHPLSNAVESHQADAGILLCGSGNGVCMTANKHTGIRAALCWNNDVASLARKHNDANVICIPARFVSEGDALTMVDTFLTTQFEGGRHQKRVDKIAAQQPTR